MSATETLSTPTFLNEKWTAGIPQVRLKLLRYRGDLVSRIMTGVRQKFEGYGHRPSDQHYDDLSRLH